MKVSWMPCGTLPQLPIMQPHLNPQRDLPQRWGLGYVPGIGSIFKCLWSSCAVDMNGFGFLPFPHSQFAELPWRFRCRPSSYLFHSLHSLHSCHHSINQSTISNRGFNLQPQNLMRLNHYKLNMAKKSHPAVKAKMPSPCDWRLRIHPPSR